MKTVAIVTLLCAVAASPAAGQNDPLQAARDLYASAAYEEALSELTRVKSSVSAPAAEREVDQYSAFCLVALGRTAEAEVLAESLVRKNPTLTVDTLEASPRIEAMFVTVRKRVLPQIIRDEYRTARAMIGSKSPDADAHLTLVRRLLTESEKIGAWDETLSDLRTLVDGFLELSHAAANDAPPAPVRAVPAPAPASTAASAPASTAAPAPAETKEATPPPDAPAVFRLGDAGVQPPVTVSQAAPQVPPALLDLARRLRRNGIVDVVIDEQGSVQDVTVRQSVNSAYDKFVVAAARTWKYQPAMRNGVPVRFVKSIVLNTEP